MAPSAIQVSTAAWTAPNATLAKTLAAVAAASLILAAFALLATPPLARFTASLSAWRDETLLGLLGLSGALIYGAALAGALKLLGLRLARP